MPKLVITDNEGSRTLALEREVKAGRLAENEIQLKVPEASRHHCRFFEEKGSWFVEDLGSSNGTLVNGRKVSKFELQDGDLIAVGAVTIRFLDTAATSEDKGSAPAGWDADEISLEAEPEKPAARATEPEPEPVAVQRADTTMVDTESAFADPTFALRDVPEQKSVVPTIMAVLLIVVLLGGLVWLYMNRERLSGDQGPGESGARAAGSNMVPRKFASFDSPEGDPSADDQAGWHKEDALDTSSAGEVQDHYSGAQGFSISRRDSDKAAGATWIALSGSQECDISIRSGLVYSIGAMARVDHGNPIPGVVVTWIEPVSGEEPREVAREVVPASPAAKKWTAISGLVQAPEGATKARVGIVAGGTGDVTFDDVVFDSAQTPPGRAVEIREFRAWLTPTGTLRVFHFTRPVSDGIGIWKAVEGGLQPPWQVFVPNAASGDAVAGTLREGGADVSVALTASENGFRTKWQLPASAPGHAIMIPLAGNADEVNVTLLDGDRAKRMRAAFQKTPASGVIVGGQGDRVRIRFLDGDNKPFSAPLDIVTDSGRAFVKLDRGDRTTITFEYEISFDAEMTQARDLVARAEDAARKGKVGESMTAYEEVLARFPFDETLEKQASTALEHLMSDGRTRIRTLTARVDDAKFFRTARLDDDLLAELEADVVRYAGTNLQPEFASKRDELKTDRARTSAEKHEAEAKAAYMRALDYVASKQSRREVAIAFLEMVVARYPETDWGRQARDLLEKQLQKAESR